MTIEIIRTEILRFLSDSEPEVLCIKGSWGVGKTYAWSKAVVEAQAAKKIALARYAYVSLFGMNSLDELKYGVFENTVSADEIGIEPSLETLKSNTSAVAKRVGRNSISFLQQLPILRSYVGSLGPVWFLSVREMVVCVDDLERRGKGLSIRDVLGLVSNLKENKRCKVVLILNDEALDNDRDEFKLFFEKVVDVSLKYAPSPSESVQISLPGTDSGTALVKDNCVKLGISNIRVIKKIERLVKLVQPLLSKFDENVFKQAVSTITLLGWCIFEPAKAPRLDFVEKRTADPFGLQDKNLTEIEARWGSLLNAFGFGHLDEFDMLLKSGIEVGFFNPTLIKEKAAELDKNFKASAGDNSFSKAWDMYHDSFENNQDAVLQAIFESFKENVHFVTQVNLNGTVKILKELGRPDQATEAIAWYMKNRNEDRKFFDLSDGFLVGDITDQDVISAFNQKFSSFKDGRTPADILEHIASHHGWSAEDISSLAALTADDYLKIFKSERGKRLRLIIGAAVQFDRMGGATEQMLAITNRAKEALRRISEESPINARRVKRYGV